MVVPRPAFPRPYEVPSDGSPGEPSADGRAADVPAGTTAGPFDGATAEPPAPAHERSPEGHSDRGPDGELRTPRVLPQRVRNASLAEQLREAHAPGAMLPPVVGPPPQAGPWHGAAGATGRTGATGETWAARADDPSPQRSRTTMAAIQRGTRTARAADPGAPTTPTAPQAPAAPHFPAAPAAAREASAVQEAKEQQ